MHFRRFDPFQPPLEPARDGASHGMPVRMLAGCGFATLFLVATASVAAVPSPPAPAAGAMVVPAQLDAPPPAGIPAEPVLVAVAIDPMSVAGTPLSTPLLVQLEPGDAHTPQDLFVLVSGLPQGVELSRGEKETDGAWRLRRDELPGLELRAEPAYAGPVRFELDMTAVADYGEGQQSITTATVPVRIFRRTPTQTASAADATEPPARADETGDAGPPSTTQTDEGEPSPTADAAPPMPEQLADAEPETAWQPDLPEQAEPVPEPRAALPDPTEPEDAMLSEDMAEPEDTTETAVLVVPTLAPAPRPDTTVEELLPPPVEETMPPTAEEDAGLPAVAPRASAPESEPATEVAAARTPHPSDALMIRRGDELFARGDLAGARLFYERAAAGGSADGALAMGKTHDPIVFERIRVRGLTPDPDRAADWYRRAAEAGNSEAEDRLQALTTWIDRQADQGDITR